MKRQGDRPPRRPSLPVSLLLATILILPPAAPSQTTAPPASPPTAESFSDTFDVNVVNVEVFVTDQQGQRVSGLTRDDFQILEDGKPVEITNFYAADVTVAAPGPGQERQSPAALVPEEQRLQLGVFVDTSNLSERPRKRLQQELTTFLSTQLSPEDRVLLATYGKEGFKALPLRAGDPKAMKESVAEVFEGSPALSQSLMQLRSLIRQIERARSPFSGNAGDAAEGQLDAARIADALDSYSKQLMQGARGSVEALDRFLSGLAGLPGRKAVLYVSGGLPLRPLEAILQSYRSKFGSSFGPPLDRSIEPLLRRVEERANANRITFYALSDAESVMPNQSLRWKLDQEEDERGNMARALDVMALPTGGLAEVNTLDPTGMLARMRDDFGSYYSLGYTPPGRKPGKSHGIQVKVNRPGLTVRHRESYRQRTSAETLADLTASALLFGARDNPLDVAVQLEEGEAEKGQRTVNLRVKLPVAKIVLVPQGDVQEGRLHVAVAVRDAEGRSSNTTIIELPVRLSKAQAQEMQGKTVGYQTKLALRPLEHVVAVGVRDTLGNLSSTVTTTWAPGAGTAR